MKRILGLPFVLLRGLFCRKRVWAFKRGWECFWFPWRLHLKSGRGRGEKVRPWKILYASPVGKLGKPYLAKIIHRFGHENFDYLIFVYDGTSFHEPVFQRCHFIHEEGILCYFFKKYLTPEYCREYDYIFPWVDDISIGTFSYIRFLDILERNRLEMAQPALSRQSLYSHAITLKQEVAVGRFTDFAEVMVQVFRQEAWAKYWELMEWDTNFWGWGYDLLAKSICGMQRIGIVDCEPVTHMNRSTDRGSRYLENVRAMEKLFDKHKDFKAAEQKVFGELA